MEERKEGDCAVVQDTNDHSLHKVLIRALVRIIIHPSESHIC